MLSFIKKSNPRFKLPFEVESWAFGFDNEFEREFVDDLDNLSEIDDSYLYDSVDDKELQKQFCIKKIIDNLYKIKELNTKKKLNPFIKLEAELEAKLNSNKKKIKQADKYKSVTNGMSRAVPGVLQQNITLERNYYRDLIKLSKQRYLYKKTADYNKKLFVNRQEKKGLLANNKSNSQINGSQKLLTNKFNNKLDPKKEKVKNIKSISVLGLINEKDDESDESSDYYETTPKEVKKRPNTSIPYVKRDTNESRLNKLSPLEDKRSKLVVKSLSKMYTSDRLLNQNSNDSVLKNILDSNKAFDGVIVHKLKGLTRSELESRKKLFEKIISDNNLA